MDYEKKYNEALERAKKFEEKYGGGYAEYIFPELAESDDERIKKTIRQLLETARDAHSNTTLAKPFIDALAWLEKQKEQKPAEWSEEDERILKGIIGKIDHDQTYGVSKVEMLSFLKELRPSWKPSEEQMKALEAATVRYQSTGLESLYEDLKKL